MSHESSASVPPAPTQADILARLLGSVASLPDRPVERVVLGACLAGVRTGPADGAERPVRRGEAASAAQWSEGGSTGLASRIASPQPGRADEPAQDAPAGRLDALSRGVSASASILYDGERSGGAEKATGGSAKAMARLLLSSDPDERTLGMAALNALLPPPPDELEMKGQDLLLRLGRGRDVCVVGHFPFVERAAGEFANFWVVEKSPRPGDYPEELAAGFMARADVAVVTGTTLLNGTLAELLAAWRRGSGKGPRAFILMGPSCPFSPALFDLGVDVLAGARVAEPDAVLSALKAGACFRGLSGVRTLLWPRPGLLTG